ncbi:MAG: hypothetical protein Ct9H300mP23_01940 [Nitrospinota bacterium]|nr:MAG: hypothetical protein Ct9H300mP23_01940 [Nitrospinota bacterium]
MGLLSFSIVEANDFELALQDLGNKSRTKIKKAIKELGNQGNPAALPALEALKGNRLRISDDGILIILNESGDKGRNALSKKQVDLKPLNLRKPRINNSVRRILSSTIGKLQLQSRVSQYSFSCSRTIVKKTFERFSRTGRKGFTQGN